MTSLDEDSISIMRLLKASLKINNDAVISQILRNANQKPNFALVCLKLDKTHGGQNWKKYLKVIENSTQHFEDLVRIQALDVLISSHSSKQDFEPQELDIITKTINLVKLAVEFD